jgi:hypothetical protein
VFRYTRITLQVKTLAKVYCYCHHSRTLVTKLLRQRRPNLLVRCFADTLINKVLSGYDALKMRERLVKINGKEATLVAEIPKVRCIFINFKYIFFIFIAILIFRWLYKMNICKMYGVYIIKTLAYSSPQKMPRWRMGRNIAICVAHCGFVVHVIEINIDTLLRKT